jgi:hypothetical protein
MVQLSMIVWYCKLNFKLLYIIYSLQYGLYLLWKTYSYFYAHRNLLYIAPICPLRIYVRLTVAKNGNILYTVYEINAALILQYLYLFEFLGEKNKYYIIQCIFFFYNYYSYRNTVHAHAVCMYSTVYCT